MKGRGASPSEFRECPGCGLFQVMPPLEPGMTAHCIRCGTVLRRARRDPLRRALALNIAALILLGVMATTTLMVVSTEGIVHSAGLFSGPIELTRQGMPELGAAVVFASFLAPLGKLAATSYVLALLHMPKPPPHLRGVFKLAGMLSPWAMTDVLVLGVLVAYSKLGDLVNIKLAVGVFALVGLSALLAWADWAIDGYAVWEALEGDDPAPRLSPHQRLPPSAVGCDTCGLVCDAGDPAAQCPRCGSALLRRKPGSIARSWALVIAAAVLYVPANLFPVLTVIRLGRGAPSTIVGGVRELFLAGQYPLALLVFFASILVPLLKLVGISFMLIMTQRGGSRWLRDRTRLYHVISWIGRWSMIDIFMELLLGALVRFGMLATITPGIGAVSFCAVVILTIFAAGTFDPRLMWDAAEAGPERGGARLQAQPSAAAAG